MSQHEQLVHHPVQQRLSVPILVLGTVGMLWSLPVPEEFVKISPILNWGSAFLIASMVYYFIISISLAIGMLPFVAGVTALQLWLVDSSLSLVRISSVMFIASIIAQTNRFVLAPVRSAILNDSN